MDANDAKSLPALGFLTVLEHPQHGLFGGYLVLNTTGRPLEFHCTAPLKPNRAQEILYGPTLQDYLYGEQIGHTLLAHAKHQPLVVCTDRQAALAVREHTSLPVVLVLPPENPPAAVPGEQILRIDAPHCGPAFLRFQLGRNRLAVPERSADDRRLANERLAELAEAFDLAEPFQRIREAIEEAQKASCTT